MRTTSPRIQPFLPLLAVAVVGCANPTPRTAPAPWHAAELLGRTDVSVTPQRSAKGLRAAGGWFLQQATKKNEIEDQSVNIGDALGTTVNEVVPIPGTDMIKVGALQEGTLFQAGFRSPAQEATTRGGTAPTDATIIFRITRP